MLPVRSVLNRAFRAMMAERDEKQRAELLDDLWAPEEAEEQAALARVAAFAEQAGQTIGGDDDGSAG